MYWLHDPTTLVSKQSLDELLTGSSVSMSDFPFKASGHLSPAQPRGLENFANLVLNFLL